MTSSVGEARDRINAAEEDAQAANQAIESAMESVQAAVEKLHSAASDSGHDSVSTARQQYEASLKSLSEAQDLIREAQASAQNYLEEIM
jgi:homoserine acetyltransferase